MIRAVQDRKSTGRYMELVRDFPLRPLRTKSDFRRAADLIDHLCTAEEGSLLPGEQDYLDTLSLLVEDYDRRHQPRDSHTDPVRLLKHLMEANDMSVSDLGKLLGSKGNASEILSGKRALSKAHISKLAKRFAVDVGLFLRPVRRDD